MDGADALKRILIIGSTSVVGRACGAVLASDASVYYAGKNDADFLLDLTDPDCTLPGWGRFDAVIHAAADFGGSTGDDFVRAEKVNALGTLNVCRLARHVNAEHLVLVSSMSACYQARDAYFSIYSLTKRHGEELAQLYCQQSGLPLTILRPTQIYDAESRCRKHQPLFYDMMDKAQSGNNIDLFGTNDAIRDLLFLDDFAEIVARTVRRKVLGPFNCPGPSVVRLSEIANAALQAFGRGGQVHFHRDRPNIADLPVIDCQACLYPIIEYWPATSLTEGILKIKRAREER